MHVVADAERALALMHQIRPDVLVTEISLPRMSGIELVELIWQRLPQTGVVVHTKHGDLENVIAALNAGARAVLGKPSDLDTVWSEVEAIAEDARAAVVPQPPSADVTRSTGRARAGNGRTESVQRALVGRSPAMVELFVKIWRASRHGLDVLIEGETGTGKECVARAIHRYSVGNVAPYVALNMAGAREDVIENELYGHVKCAYTGADSDRNGLLVAAGSGTIVLDEIGDAPEKVQRSLLRALQERAFLPVGGSSVDMSRGMCKHVLPCCGRDARSLRPARRSSYTTAIQHVIVTRTAWPPARRDWHRRC